MTVEERKRLIVKYLKTRDEEKAKFYVDLFNKREIVEIINEMIRNKDGLLIIGCNIHDYIDKNTKCFYLLLQWIKTNGDEYADVYIGKVTHAFDDLLKTKKFWSSHVDLSDLESESEEVITKIEKLSSYLNNEDKKEYIIKEIEGLRKEIKKKVKVNNQHDVTVEELKEIIPYMTVEERKRLIVKYLKTRDEEKAKFYVDLFNKREIVEIINEMIRNKDGLLIIGCNIHDYIDKNTKCFYLLLQWIKTNGDEYADVYIGKVTHAFDDLLKTKKFWSSHVDLSDLESESEEVITKIEKLVITSLLDKDKKIYLLKEIEGLKK
jgi:ribosomal protein S15P/S13E